MNIDLPIVAAPKLLNADVAEEAPVPPLAIDRSVPDQSPLLIARVPPNTMVPVEVIVPPVSVNPFFVPDVATDVTPEDVTYLPSRSTVTLLKPCLAAVNIPLVVLKLKLVK